MFAARLRLGGAWRQNKPVRHCAALGKPLGFRLIFQVDTGRGRFMEELIRTNDLVLISFVEALLRDAGIELWVADQNMSIIEGSLGILQRRVMVPADRLAQARRLLTDAGIGGELRPPPRGG